MMAGVSSMRDDADFPDLSRAIKESAALHSHDTEARTEQTSKNPIYGYIGGAETCWFNSALQMLLNTQKYREWIQTVITNPSTTDPTVTQKCFFLHTALRLIHDKEKYPFDISKPANRFIDITDFINYANRIRNNTTINFNDKPTVFGDVFSGQQDPFLLINDITDCINYGTYQQQYINIYHNQSNGEIEWSKPVSDLTSSDRFITNLISSVELPSRITNEENIIRMPAQALIRKKSNEFTSLQQLLDIIPKPLKKMSRKTDQRLVEKSRFLSDLKLFSTVSLYERFNSLKYDSSINTLKKYIDEVLTNLTTLYNKPRLDFSYEKDVTDWFNKYIDTTPLIITTIHNTDVKGIITSTNVRFIQDDSVDIINIINTIFSDLTNKSINGLLSALSKSSDPKHQKIASVLDFHEDPKLKPILQGMYDNYFTYVSGDYIMIQMLNVDLARNRYNHLSNIRYELIQSNHVFTFGDKKYFLTCIMWHSGTIKGGHYVSEINIVNPPHKSIERGLYLCNDSTTEKIDHWKSFDANMIPSSFVFQNAALTPELSPVDFPVSPPSLSSTPAPRSVLRSKLTSPTPITKTLPGGVVQVFQEKAGEWGYNDSNGSFISYNYTSSDTNVKPRAKQNAELIFKPILDVIDSLIYQGYEHIGLTYSANQEQTAEMFKAYEFNHNENTRLSDKVLNQEIKPSSFSELSGSGQAFVLGFHKDVLSHKDYSTKFRIIPFSTMKHPDARGGLSPDESLGSISDCINFANLFLKQKNSIILGWSTDPVNHKLDKSNIRGLINSHSSNITGWISIGGDMCRNKVKTPKPGIDIMNDYATWALTNWNPDAQNFVDSLPKSSSMKTTASVAAATAAATAAFKKGSPSKSISPPSPITPVPALNDVEGFKRELIDRVANIHHAAAHIVGESASKNIAILVNGGSFNPIHNGHLEMFTLARQHLLASTGSKRTETGGGRNYFDVIVIYVVSSLTDLLNKNAPDSGKITYDKDGDKYRIKLCREAFASIDDVSPDPNKIKLASDGEHLSKNMFVWPDETSNAYSISDQFSELLKGFNITFYGLAGSDKVIPDDGKTINPGEQYYFLHGIGGNSIIVERGRHDLTDVFTNFNPNTVNSSTPPPYDPKNGKISIKTNSIVSSSNIQPQINQLRDYLKHIVANGEFNKIITDPSCNERNKDASKCIPVIAQDRQIYQIQQFVQGIPVPHSILFKLITYGENPTPSIKGNKSDTAWCGYKEFRRYLFRNKLDNLYHVNKSGIDNWFDELKKYQIPQTVQDKLTPFTPNKKNGIIDFLQMTSGHALFIQGGRSVTTSVLNFANPKHVGGGVMYGSWVQEETLCMMSPLLYLTLACINGVNKLSSNDIPTPRHIYETAWGETNWDKKFFYTADTKALDFDTTDEFTFGFPAPWIQQTNYNTGMNYYFNTTTNNSQWNTPRPPFKGHVITAAAYDWINKPNPDKYEKNEEFNNSMIRMIQNMAYVAAIQQKCDVLVLGAWGCGAFAPKTGDKNPVPGYIEHVARLFCRALLAVIPGGETENPITYKDLFDKVIFPIPDCNTYDKFKEAFDAEERIIIAGGGGVTEDDDVSVSSEVSEIEGDDDGSEGEGGEGGEGGGISPPKTPSSTRPAIVEVPPPYITLTNMIAGIDSGIDHFVEQISNRNPLREISVNEQDAANRTKDTLKLTRVDGEFPKSTVPLYEQMVYHRAGSMNLKPLAIFIPSGYKINFQEITDYFREMERRNDPETQELMALVINAYGNNNNSLFYKHTLPGKLTTATGVGSTMTGITGMTGMTGMTGGAPMKNVFDLDEKTAQRIQVKIDNWHNKYMDWRFYQNATRFFVENQKLPKNEVVALKIVFDDVFESSSGKGLMKIIEDIQKKHSGDHTISIDGINDLYIHFGSKIQKGVIRPVLVHYITFFNVIFKEITKHMSDTLNFTQSRQNELGYKYKFDQNVKNDLFKLYSEIKNIIDSFGDDITKIPYLKLIDLFQVFTQQINELNRRFPSQLKDVFHSSIAKNDRLSYREYYKTYKLIQYIYWLMSDRKSEPNPFESSYDKLSPNDVNDKANLSRGDELTPNFDVNTYIEMKETINLSHFDHKRILPRAEKYVDMVENEEKHVARLIRIYENVVKDRDLIIFMNKNMYFRTVLGSYNDIRDKNTIDLQFGIDLLFYVLYYVTNNVVSELNKNKALFDKIDDKNGELFTLRQEIRLKESKLTHMFDLISKQIGIPVERIMPDRSEYYYSKTSKDPKLSGLIDGKKYHDAWALQLSSSSSNSIAKRINYVTTNMKNSLNKALGLADDSNGTNLTVVADNNKKIKKAMIELLEHNTVQVVHMLFAKPRVLWYSPDMRIGSLSGVSKWVFLRLENPEIVTKSGFKLLNQRWNEDVSVSGTPQPRLDLIIDKTMTTRDVFNIKVVDETAFNSNKLPTGQGGLCVLLIASQPSPQMIEPGKDSSNDSRFQNPSFSIGDVQPSVRDDHAVGAKIMDNLTRLIKPDPQKCNNVRGLIQEQANELSAITKNLLKSIGVETSIQLTGLKNKFLATSPIYKAMSLLSVVVKPYNPQTSPPQANINEALRLTTPYKGDPDYDAVIGYCEFLNALRSTPLDTKMQEDSVRSIMTAYTKGSEYSLTIIGLIKLHPDIADDIHIQNIILDALKDEDKVEADEGISGEGDESSTREVSVGGRRRIYIGGAPDKIKTAVLLLKRGAKTTPFAKVKLVEMLIDKRIDEEALSNIQAMNMLRTAANESYTPAEYILAKVLKDGLLGETKDLKKAVIYYERAAAMGHKDASYELGLLYKDGVKVGIADVVRKDLNKAIKLFTTSSKVEKGIVEFDYTIQNTTHANTKISNIQSEIKAQNDMKIIQPPKSNVEESPETFVKESPQTSPEELDDDVLKVAAKEASEFLEHMPDSDGGGGGSGGVAGVRGVGSGVVTGVSGVGSGVVTGVRGVGSGVVTGVRGVGSGVVTGVREVGSGGVTGVSGVGSGGVTVPAVPVMIVDVPLVQPKVDIHDIPITLLDEVTAPKVVVTATAAAASAAAASSAAASSAPAAAAASIPFETKETGVLGKKHSPPPKEAGPDPLPLMTPDDIRAYELSLRELTNLLNQIERRLTSYTKGGITPTIKNDLYTEIANRKKEIDENLQAITDASYSERAADKNIRERYKTQLVNLNADYNNITTRYDNLKRRLDGVIMRDQLEKGDFATDELTGKLYLVPASASTTPSTTPSSTSSSAKVGGGKHIQKGGRIAYEIPFDSDLYRGFEVELFHPRGEFKEQHPDFFRKVIDGIESGEIKEIDDPSIEPVSSSQPPAYVSAKNPVIIRNMLSGITQNPNNLIKKYDEIVQMCSPDTAVSLVKSLLESKKQEVPKNPGIDKQIRKRLGWENNENKLLYDVNLVRRTATPTANGLFSKFCFHTGKFSVFMSRHCQKDYICMLNWVIIIAFRLVRDEPGKYSNERTIELIENIHKTLVGEIFHGSGDLANRMFLSSDTDPALYSMKVKEWMVNEIFDDVSLRELVIGIKKEIQKLPEPDISIIEPKNPEVIPQKPDPRIHKTTQKGYRGGIGKENKVTRKHRHERERVEETTKHTRKHKIYTLCLNKTRRNK